MGHEWTAGVLSQSSWHKLETVRDMRNWAEQRQAGLESGAWPLEIGMRKIYATAQKIECPGQAVIARYADGSLRGLATVGDKYQPLTPRSWDLLGEAACDAGAKPAGAFSLRNGTRRLATWEVSSSGQIRNFLALVDAFDGSLNTQAGLTSIRPVCANTLSAALSRDGKNWAKIRHTGDMHVKAESLAIAVKQAIESGQSVADLYERARDTQLGSDDISALIAVLFPKPAENAAPRTHTIRDGLVSEFVYSMQRPENRDGASLATVWNAATWLVDRTSEGYRRTTRTDALDSMLFGSRAKRVAEIEDVIQGWLTDASALVATVQA